MKTSNESFVLYDLETSGTVRGYDQIVQIAALHTDANFEIKDTIELRCRRLAHIIPSPEAMLITRADPAVLEAANCSHYQLVRESFQRFSAWASATFCAHMGCSSTKTC